MDRDNLDNVAVADPTGRGYLMVERGEVVFLEQVYGARASVGRGPTDLRRGLPVCIYRAHMMARSMYQQAKAGGRTLNIERYPLEVREVHILLEGDYHQCNEDCWPAASDRIAQLLFKWEQTRQEKIAALMLANIDRFGGNAESVFDEVMSEASEWDKHLQMIPDYALDAVFQLAECAKNGLVELDDMQPGWERLQGLLRDKGEGTP